jgi:hypothetical protein
MHGLEVKAQLGRLPVMLLYVGPDQLVPLSGFLGTVAGLVLIFWSKLAQGVRRLLGILARPSQNPR